MAIDMVRLNGVLNGRVNVTGVNGGAPSGAGALVVHMSAVVANTDIVYTLDQTWQAIFDALCSGRPVVQIVNANNVQGEESVIVCYIGTAYYANGSYYVFAKIDRDDDSTAFSCASADDYPVFVNGGK